MDFRWVAAIALWTLLSGPIFHPGKGEPRASHQSKTPAAAQRAVGR